MSLDEYLYTLDLNELGGPVTEGNPIRNLLGDNLSVTGGQLDAAGGGGAFGTKATATGQEGEYIVDAGATTDMIAGSVSSQTGTPYIEQRSGTFAADGVPSVRDRGQHSGQVGGNYLYTWERDLSAVTGGATPPSGNPRGLTWDGSRFYMTDNFADYIYELDNSYTVTGGSTWPSTSVNGIVWDGTRFIGVDLNGYIYELDTNFAVTGGTPTPGQFPTGICWDRRNFILLIDAGYMYELDTNLDVTGGASSPASSPRSIAWDGDRFVLVADYFYEFDSELDLTGGRSSPSDGIRGIAWDGGKYVNVDSSADYIYELAGSYDFTIGSIT